MDKSTITIGFLWFILFSSLVFSQSYGGPAQGSVASGIQVNLGSNLGDHSISGDVNSVGQVHEYMVGNTGELPLEDWGNINDNYIYVEDIVIDDPELADIGINVELNSFEGIPETSSIPPDNHVAVGPNHVIACVNSVFRVFEKDGNLLMQVSADSWCGQALSNPDAFDPQIIYDHFEGRWFMLWDNHNDGTLSSNFIISYSDDSDPMGIWYMYVLNGRVNGTTSTNYWADYPQLGYDDQAIYIMSRQFEFGCSSSCYRYNRIRILNKSELYTANGGQLTWTDIWNIRDPNNAGVAPDNIHPVISFDTGLNTGYFVWTYGFGSINYCIIYKIANPVTSPVLTGQRYPVTFYGSNPPVNQLGGGTPHIDNGGNGIRTAPILKNGKIYSVHSQQNSQHLTNISLKYFVYEISSNSIIQEVEFGSQGHYYIYPSIVVDGDENLAITYSRSGDNEYIGAYYSTRLASDPPGLSPSKVMHVGMGNYVKTYGGSRNRWGDYLSGYLDPATGYDFWLFSEYAARTNTWGTWLTEIRMKPYSGPTFYTRLNPIEFGNLEIGIPAIIDTITIANYGDADYIINNIVSSVGPFTLLNNPSPVTLSTFDSLDLIIQFNPSTPAIYSELMQFDDNDPNFDGLTLNGTGFEINQGFTDLFYASTGVNENGKMLTLNKNTGVGTELGFSNFNNISSLTVSPVTNIIYGISSGQNETEIVRVNGSGGDAFTQYVVDLGAMSGISFDTSGVLYATQILGDIYTIDLSDGSYSSVTTASIQLSAIAINPMTNEMWAVPKVVFGAKDKIYKVNLSSGAATLIGQTGFVSLTNDLAFDENGNLYGIIGESAEIGQLISIDTSNAVGTLIGDIGFQNVISLGYSVNGPVNSVKSDDILTHPDNFVLSQNYPNPFNPNTSIKFSIPVDTKVRLTVYNILGQAVNVLVDEELTSGHYSVDWNGTDNTGNIVSSGIYFYEMKASGNKLNDFTQIRKMVFLK